MSGQALGINEHQASNPSELNKTNLITAQMQVED